MKRVIGKEVRFPDRILGVCKPRDLRNDSVDHLGLDDREFHLHEHVGEVGIILVLRIEN